MRQQTPGQSPVSNNPAMKQRANAGRPVVREVTTRLLADWPLPDPSLDSDHLDRGRVLEVAGSRQMPGAAILAGVAALRAGAARLCIATGRSAATAVALAIPEAQVLGLRETPKGGLSRFAARECDPEFDSILVGPGLRDDDATARVVQGLRATFPSTPIVLDGRAIGALQNEHVFWNAHPAGGVLITPGAAELASLSGCTREAIVADRVGSAVRIARRWRVAVALKGAVPCVCLPDGTAWGHTGGTTGLATAGAGDVLAGLVTGLIARGASLDQAAVWGLALIARAGEALAARRGPVGYLARELSEQIPGLMLRLTPVAVSQDGTRRAGSPGG